MRIIISTTEYSRTETSKQNRTKICCWRCRSSPDFIAMSTMASYDIIIIIIIRTPIIHCSNALEILSLTRYQATCCVRHSIANRDIIFLFCLRYSLHSWFLIIHCCYDCVFFISLNEIRRAKWFFCFGSHGAKWIKAHTRKRGGKAER